MCSSSWVALRQRFRCLLGSIAVLLAVLHDSWQAIWIAILPVASLPIRPIIHIASHQGYPRLRQCTASSRYCSRASCPACYIAAVMSSSATGIITVAASKGGVGKTTLAYELAAALKGVLIDLDWDGGGATAMWGYNPLARQRAVLLDALERGPNQPPRQLRRAGQPLLVPSSPDLAASRIPSDLVADCLQGWAKEWEGQPVVVDTHPGANELTDGALTAADLVVVPVVLGVRELDALERMVEEYSAFRLALVPSMVSARPVKRSVERLRLIAATSGIPVLPIISEHRFLRRRLRRRAVVAEPMPGRAVSAAAREYLEVADAVGRILNV